jgi:signal transduction histidine kinase
MNSPSIIRIPFLFTVAAFYGYLVERARRGERRAASVQDAMRARQEFLTTVTHEIRTPMHCLLGWTDLLLDTDFDAEQRDLAERLRRSGRSLLAI